jgi:hypothetical protein
VDVEGKTFFDWATASFMIPRKPEKKYEKLAEQQWQWLEQQLKEST